MQILVTGSAGFIGFHLCKRLLAAGHSVIGIDNFNDYYDVNLKKDRSKILHASDNYHEFTGDIADVDSIWKTFVDFQNIDIVVNLAAQAGVRYSLTNPQAYIDSNVTGFVNILEIIKEKKIPYLVYASSSSVYGRAEEFPLREDMALGPVSLYGATKVFNEVTAASYYDMYKIESVGLRYFTVIGPYGRPDMALFKFTKSILSRASIDIYGYGQLMRDFTYIDDIIDGTMAIIDRGPDGCEIYNIGRGEPVNLEEFILKIEAKLGSKASKIRLPHQTGDVVQTWADTTRLRDEVGYAPKISIDESIERFIDWYKEYYAV